MPLLEQGVRPEDLWSPLPTPAFGDSVILRLFPAGQSSRNPKATDVSASEGCLFGPPGSLNASVALHQPAGVTAVAGMLPDGHQRDWRFQSSSS